MSPKNEFIMTEINNSFSSSKLFYKHSSRVSNQTAVSSGASVDSFKSNNVKEKNKNYLVPLSLLVLGLLAIGVKFIKRQNPSTSTVSKPIEHIITTNNTIADKAVSKLDDMKKIIEDVEIIPQSVAEKKTSEVITPVSSVLPDNVEIVPDRIFDSKVNAQTVKTSNLDFYSPVERLEPEAKLKAEKPNLAIGKGKSKKSRAKRKVENPENTVKHISVKKTEKPLHSKSKKDKTVNQKFVKGNISVSNAVTFEVSEKNNKVIDFARAAAEKRKTSVLNPNEEVKGSAVITPFAFYANKVSKAPVKPVENVQKEVEQLIS